MKRNEDINKQVYISLIAEQAESYKDMRFYLEQYILIRKKDITIDERNLLSVAYKNIFEEIRITIRTVVDIEINESNSQNNLEKYLDYIREYREKLEKELVEYCESVVDFIKKNLLPVSTNTESKIFYLKLMGDYYRYIAENLEDRKKKYYAEKSLQHYSEAKDIMNELLSTNHVRLSLILNMSVLYYEVLNNQVTGLQIARSELDLIKQEIDKLDKKDENNVDTFHLIEMIQENLNIWSLEAEY